jgi:prevent-host-death family protein
MKTISIRDLHEKTGAWIRRATTQGALIVTDRGKPVARIVPEVAPPSLPFFARRAIPRALRGLSRSGKLRGGTDSTRAISDDRDRDVL